MKRETTNKIRYVLEEIIPPAMRDSHPFRWLFRQHWGRLIDDIERFRINAHHVDEEVYSDIYSAMPRIQEGTDNSDKCVARITDDILSGSVLDVGCGTGELLRRIKSVKGVDGYSYTGVDFQADQESGCKHPDVKFVKAMVEDLPFADNSFDTVICTHLLEHILDIRKAILELRRVAAQRLIIIVPKEREYRFTFNPHLHFFPYRHSFLRQMLPVPTSAVCEYVGRDIYYCEDIAMDYAVDTNPYLAPVFEAENNDSFDKVHATRTFQT